MGSEQPTNGKRATVMAEAYLRAANTIIGNLHLTSDNETILRIAEMVEREYQRGRSDG